MTVGTVGQVLPTPSPASASGSQTSQSNSNQLTGNDFISLLTAQIQNQDPTNPTDPTEFVTQEVEFNMLQQLISMNSLLQQALTPQTSGTTQTGQTTPVTGGN